MSDDIVTRLRMSADLMQGFPQMKTQHFNAEWVAEAADEIERLRKELDQWRKTAAAYRYCGKCDWCEEQWEKATGNEQD